MPFELANIIKNTFGCNFASKGVNSLFCSKFYTTALLTIMIIILIMLIYPCKKNTSAFILFKLGFYIFIVSIGILFIHDSVVYHIYKKESNNMESENFINSIHAGENVAFGGVDDQVPVNAYKGGIESSEMHRSVVNNTETHVIDNNLNKLSSYDSIFDDYNV